jgi:sec-independent protein translocase protein TatA
MEGLFQPMHLIIILIIVLIIFGPGRLPQIGEGLGKSIRGFKKAMNEPDEAKKEEAKSEAKAIEQKDEKKSQ